MGEYNNFDYDNLVYELNDFLRDHTVSELLMLVTEVVRRKESGYE